MQKCFTIYGNCQAHALAKTLLLSKTFKEQYKYIQIQAVHELNTNDIKQVHTIVSTIDLFIFINVSESYKGIDYSTNYLCTLLKKDCIIMSFPCCYFSAYSPELKYVLIEGKRLTQPNDIHDHKLIECYLKNDKKVTTINFITNYLMNETLYEKQYLLDMVNNSINELVKRELDISNMSCESKNVKNKSKIFPLFIADYIKQNYKKIRLFLTYNHPTYHLFNHLANQIFVYLNIKDMSNCTENYLLWQPFIYLSVYKHLELEFDNQYEHCQISNMTMSVNEFVNYYCKSYDNIQNIEKISSITF